METITSILSEFTPVRSLDELKALEPGTRVSIEISREERGYRVEQELACFTGYDASSQFYPFSFLDKPQEGRRLTGFSCNECEVGFSPDGILVISGTPGISLVRSWCEPQHREAYERNLRLLEKSRLLS